MMVGEINKKTYNKLMFQLRNRYLKLIKEYGFPTERTTGFYFKSQFITSIRDLSQNYFCKKVFTTNGSENDSLILVVSEEPTGSILTYKPSYDFLTHYVNPKDYTILDSTLFNILLDGFENLKISPIVIIMSKESTRKMGNEFAISYYSRLWAYQLKFNYFKKYELPEKTIKIINKNRKMLYIPSLQKEEKLLKALYKEVHGKAISKHKLKKFNTKGDNTIKAFIDYM